MGSPHRGSPRLSSWMDRRLGLLLGKEARTLKIFEVFEKGHIYSPALSPSHMAPYRRRDGMKLVRRDTWGGWVRKGRQISLIRYQNPLMRDECLFALNKAFAANRLRASSCWAAVAGSGSRTRDQDLSTASGDYCLAVRNHVNQRSSVLMLEQRAGDLCREVVSRPPNVNRTALAKSWTDLASSICDPESSSMTHTRGLLVAILDHAPMVGLLQRHRWDSRDEKRSSLS